MGTGISTACGSKRSVLIANSVRKLPPIPENDSDIESGSDRVHGSRKLHAAESRDSGIGENDVPNGFLFHKTGSGFLKGSSTESSPEKKKENKDDHSSRASRPQSCRLGHRGHHGNNKNGKNAELSDSQIRSMVRSARGQPGVPISGDISDDTLSNASSPSPTLRNRPKSAKRKTRTNTARSGRNSRNSAKTISDLETSTDTDGSDTDMLSIPDETGAFTRGKEEPPKRRGWVQNEDFTDVILTSSFTPRVVGTRDMYRIVSGTFTDYDVNLAKKASERSISSIILTPVDGTVTPTNSECFDPSNEMYITCDGSLEDLVSSLVVALDRQRTRGPCTAHDYETVMKGLRYQLVGMAMGYACNQITPRIEVKGEQRDIFTEDSWRVQIRLRSEDEEIIETSEKVLAERLAAKGQKVSREDIQILLAEHLKTIEKIQQVNDTAILEIDESASQRNAGNSNKLNITNRPKRPESASKLRKLNSGRKASSNVKSELPPIGKSKGGKSVGAKSLPKLDCLPVKEKGGDSVEIEPISPESSPDTRTKNRPTFNESGIESDQDNPEPILDEVEGLNNEFIEAVQILWDSLTAPDLGDLLKEFRRRETYLLLTGSQPAKPGLKHSTSHSEKTDKKCAREIVDQEISTLDEQFVSGYEHKQSLNGIKLDKFLELLNAHMKKTRLIRVQSFSHGESDIEWTGSLRSNSFTGFGSQKGLNGSAPNTLKRQHSFSGATQRPNSLSTNGVLSRQNSFVRSLPGSRQGSYYRSRSRGSTGSSNTYSTYSTTSSGISSGQHSELSDSSAKSALSREFSYGILNEFEDIEELDEESKTARDTARETARKSGLENHLPSANETLRPPSGRRSNSGMRATSGNVRDRENRRGQTQTHGLGHSSTPTESAHTTPLRKIEEDVLPKVEEIDAKVTNVRSRPDSGIAVSMSSASYSSSEPHKERDLEEPYLTMSCQEMVEKVSKIDAKVTNVRSRPDSGIAVSMSSASYSSSEPHKERDLEEPYLTMSCQEMVEKVSKIDVKVTNVRSRPDSGIAVSMSSASYSSSEPHKERDLEEPYLTMSCQEMVEKVSKIDAKVTNVRSRPDSGIAVSMSSASYSSSEPHKERDLEEPYLTMSCQEMVEKVSKVPAEQHNDIKSLVAAVTKGSNSEHMKAHSLYCWLTTQDLTKFDKVTKKSSSPPGRLKQLHEKKTTFCSVYIEMLKVAGLKCERVEGYVKNKDYLPGNTVQTQKFLHSWVAVSMDGHYRLVDPQFGASGEKFVQDHFFATSPDELILSHFPKDKKWLLMNTPATIEEFEGHLKTWPAMFHFVIRPLNMKSVIRTYDGRLSITVLLQDVAVNPQLEYAGPGKEIDTDTLEEQIDHEIRDVDNAETYHVTLPQEGNYYFTVYAHVLEDCIDVPVFQYRIEYVDELL